MTIHIVPIADQVGYRHDDPSFTAIFRVYQTYRPAHNDTSPVSNKETFRWERAFQSQDAMDKALSSDDTIAFIAQELKVDALKKYGRGLSVASTLIAFSPDCGQGYAFDNLDARHLKRALRHHLGESKAEIGTTPHLAWNITKSGDWHEAADDNFQERMKNLILRKKHLKNLPLARDKAIVDDFAKVAGIWFNKGKGLEMIGDFFMTLMKNKRYEAHRQCMEIWGNELGKKPESVYYNYRTSLVYDHKLIRGDFNPLMTPKDSFASLNTLLAMFPETCLSSPDLLSDTWLNVLKDPGQRDAGLIAIMSGYARFQKTVQRHEIDVQTAADCVKGVRVTEEVICVEFWRRLEQSAGMVFEDLLTQMGDCPEGGSPIVAAFFSQQLKSRNIGVIGDDYPLPLGMQSCNELSLRHVPQTLDFMVKAKLVTHPSYGSNYVHRYPQDLDREFYRRILSYPGMSIEHIKVLMPYERVTKAEFLQMESIDPHLVKGYMADMGDKEIGRQVSKGNIPPRYVQKAKHRDKMMSSDLGL